MTQKESLSARWRARVRRRRNLRGVSPIIATILLVAITVVLAAVLYVLVSGLTRTGVSTPYELGMGWLSSAGTGTNYTEVLSISGTSGLATALFGLKIVTPGGTSMTVGTVATATCYPKTTLVAPQTSCTTGVASGWFALLVNPSGFLAASYGKNATTSNVQWNYASGTTTIAINGGYQIWLVSQASLSGNTIAAYGTGTSSVSGTQNL
jgi:flagellin-like protein